MARRIKVPMERGFRLEHTEVVGSAASKEPRTDTSVVNRTAVVSTIILTVKPRTWQKIEIRTLTSRVGFTAMITSDKPTCVAKFANIEIVLEPEKGK